MINIREGDREHLVTFLTDFNGVNDHNQLRALGRYATAGWQGLGIGDYVVAHDSEGNECVAYIEARRGADLFDLRADWDSWVPSDQPKIRVVFRVPLQAQILVPAGLA